jgi:antitoxin HigA-1
MKKKLHATHPGDVLKLDFLEPLEISVYRLAHDIGVPVTRIHQIVHRERGITADTAIRLGKYFKTSPELWLNLQAHFDIETTDVKKITSKIKVCEAMAA